VLQQGPVLRALVRAAGTALRSGREVSGQLPGPEHTATVPPRPGRLLDDYIRHVGGDRSWYRRTVPAHLFPQWGFPLLARTLEEIPYDLRNVLNAGCRLDIRQPLPRGEALQLRGWLDDIDDDGKRALLTQKLVTGTASAPDALHATVFAFVRLPRDPSAPRDTRKKKDKARVPADARELARYKLTPQDGMDFAILTGDFNPVHWIKPYARAAGFRSTILHGFATMARAIEGLNRTLFSGDPSRLHHIEVRFTRPLILPARVGLYVTDDHGLFVGAAPGGPAYLTGTFNDPDRQDSDHG
jgi:acyl dehydratase